MTNHPLPVTHYPKCLIALLSVQARQAAQQLITWQSRDVLSQNSLLAGDAASLADPLSGEGIRPAIVSGFKAAEAIELLEIPTMLRSSTLNRSPKNWTIIWFGPVA